MIEAFGGKSLKAQLRQANTLGVRYAVIIGSDEGKDGRAVFRDMTSAQQETVPLDRLPELLK